MLVYALEIQVLGFAGLSVGLELCFLVQVVSLQSSGLLHNSVLKGTNFFRVPPSRIAAFASVDYGNTLAANYG